MKPNKTKQKPTHGGYRAGAGRRKISDPKKTKSVRIPSEITRDDIRLLAKYKNHDLPLYNMEVENGVPSISSKEKYEIQKADKKLLINDIEDHFLVKVAGQNMKESGILENDILLVNQSKPYGHNDIVVAGDDDGKAVLKKLIKEGDAARLICDNKNCADFDLDENSINRIWGVVTRVIRDYPN